MLMMDKNGIFQAMTFSQLFMKKLKHRANLMRHDNMIFFFLDVFNGFSFDWINTLNHKINHRYSFP